MIVGPSEVVLQFAALRASGYKMMEDELLTYQAALRLLKLGYDRYVQELRKEMEPDEEIPTSEDLDSWGEADAK